MTQEEKQLLLADLCARLPYGVKVCIKLPNHQEKIFEEQIGDLEELTIYGGYLVNLKGIDYRSFNLDIKPYLRPMTSMTEEEMDEVEMIMGVEDNKSIIFDFTSDGNIIFKNGNCSVGVFKKLIDYLYSCHFDFYNLIEKGLAIEAPEGMYK